MLEGVRSFFLARLSHPEGEPSPDRVAIAACALLLEIAHADGFGPEEKASILRALREDLGVADEDVQQVVQLAEDARRDSVDLYQFTRLVAENFSTEQRRRLVEAIWRVVYADGTLSALENHMARRIADLLGFQHPEIQEIKERVSRSVGHRENVGKS
jgi:uncharacterized tellurite resistance protein B-like protein